MISEEAEMQLARDDLERAISFCSDKPESSFGEKCHNHTIRSRSNFFCQLCIFCIHNIVANFHYESSSRLQDTSRKLVVWIVESTGRIFLYFLNGSLVLLGDEETLWYH